MLIGMVFLDEKYLRKQLYLRFSEALQQDSSFSTPMFWARWPLAVRGCPLHCRTCGSNPGLHHQLLVEGTCPHGCDNWTVHPGTTTGTLGGRQIQPLRYDASFTIQTSLHFLMKDSQSIGTVNNTAVEQKLFLPTLKFYERGQVEVLVPGT